ncbi:uncharacterized protein LOC62_06G008062 [Vanrija pseudolonga]|uniref:Uncharacterized protein n=1 Tax=Vanrija pseudolonga TaxID=143232 RepID=A0AAF0YGT4_9TREE|nr:hypothetical protein LOC62_06G008062 [Vanrija pseudolonga]
MKTTTAALILIATLAGTKAIDSRLLVTIPSCVDATTWGASFTSTCADFQPAIDDGNTYAGALFEDCDYSGKNCDTKARVSCSYTDPDGNAVYYTQDVVESLGGSLA